MQYGSGSLSQDRLDKGMLTSWTNAGCRVVADWMRCAAIMTDSRHVFSAESAGAV